ncbi:helix-turn-helix transcriptional regulator [Roseibium sp.]|uniref:helix-turn-helix transcriptional regulator n=1 Tax=Roseibium sp. TaxID=1936156 RepID=UPI003B50A78B
MATNLDTLLNRLYSASLLDGGLTGVLEDIAQAYPDVPLSYQAQCVFRNSLYEGAVFNYGPNALEEISSAEAPNPFPPIALKCSLNRVAVTSDHIPPDDIERSDFFDEHLRKHGEINRALGIILHRQGQDSAFVAANLPKRLKQREEEHILRLFETLRPHLQGAFRLLMEVKQREVQLQTGGFWLEQIPTAAFAITPDYKVLQMNRHANKMTKAARHLQLDRSVRLCTVNRSAQRVLEASLHKAHDVQRPIGPISLTSGKQGGPLLFVMPVRFQDQMHPSLAPFLRHSMPLLVTVFDPADTPLSSNKALKMAFGITDGESRLLQELIRGGSLRDAADRLEISYHTARNQLASTTSKTGTRSQTEIVRRASELLSRMSTPTVLNSFSEVASEKNGPN